MARPAGSGLGEWLTGTTTGMTVLTMVLLVAWASAPGMPTVALLPVVALWTVWAASAWRVVGQWDIPPALVALLRAALVPLWLAPIIPLLAVLLGA